MESTTRRIVLISILLIIALAVFLTMNYLHTGRREYYQADELTDEEILMLQAQAQQDTFTNRNEEFNDSEDSDSDLEDAIRAAVE